MLYILPTVVTLYTKFLILIGKDLILFFGYGFGTATLASQNPINVINQGPSTMLISVS